MQIKASESYHAAETIVESIYDNIKYHIMYNLAPPKKITLCYLYVLIEKKQ